MKLASFGEMTRNPQKSEKNVCFQLQCRPFPAFQAYFILVENWPIQTYLLSLKLNLVKKISYNNVCHFWAIFASARI